MNQSFDFVEIPVCFCPKCKVTVSCATILTFCHTTKVVTYCLQCDTKINAKSAQFPSLQVSYNLNVNPAELTDSENLCLRRHEFYRYRQHVIVEDTGYNAMTGRLMCTQCDNSFMKTDVNEFRDASIGAGYVQAIVDIPIQKIFIQQKFHILYRIISTNKIRCQLGCFVWNGINWQK